MRKLLPLLCIIILCSCKNDEKVSDENKKYMETVLYDRLQLEYCNAYLDDEDLDVLPETVEIKSIYKRKNEKGMDRYLASFGCTFYDNGQKIYLLGDAEFDYSRQIVKMPKGFGDDKINVSISIILIDNVSVDAKKINSNKYVLNCFMNRNKVVGNE